MKSTKTKAQKPIIFRFIDERVAGPSQVIQVSDNERSRLLHNNRPIRYSKNQKSPYIDEQEGLFMRGTIIFNEGNLVVDANDEPTLNFLRVHPQLGTVFYEVDHERMAAAELEDLNMEADAMIFAKTADIELLGSAIRVMMESDVDNMSVKEIRRDAMILAKRDPYRLLSIKSDPSFEIQDVSIRSVSEGHLSLRNNGMEVRYNFPDKKTKLLVVPEGSTWQESLQSYFQTDEGVELYQILKKLLGV